MKLAPRSVPYRVLEKSGSLLLTVVFLASFGSSLPFGTAALVGLVAVILLAIVGYEVAYYRRFRYELTADTFDLSSGVFSRREREIPYGRIQNVDSSRNVLQRLVGLAVVNIETAGGGSTEAVIKYVTAEEAERLQRALREAKRDRRAAVGGDRSVAGDTDVEADAVDAAADVDTDPAGVAGTDSDADEEELLFELNSSELVLAGVLSFDPRVPGLLLALFTGSIPFVSPIIPTSESTLVFGVTVGILALGAVVLAWVVGALSEIINYWGFRLFRSGEELRYERGLLQRYSGTVPFDKIQAMTIEDNPLKRRAGYATLAVETAGYAPGQSGGRGTEAAVPLARRSRVERLAAEIDAYGTPEFSRPPKRIRRRYLVRYLLALGAITAALYAVSRFVAVAADIPWYLPALGALLTPVAAHYTWLHRGYWLGEAHAVTRNGFWNRETKIVPYYRIQTVIDSRSLFQRRWNVASVVVDTAGSLSLLGTDCAAVDVDVDDAKTLRAALTDRLGQALADRRATRRAADWLADPSLDVDTERDVTDAVSDAPTDVVVDSAGDDTAVADSTDETTDATDDTESAERDAPDEDTSH